MPAGSRSAGAAPARLTSAGWAKRPFVNVASAGLAPVAADEAGSMKRVLGPLAYSVGAVRAGLRARPLHCSARCEDAEAFSGAAWQLTVACSGAFGGGASLDADPADGALDLAVIEAGPRLRLVQRAYGMRRGTDRWPGGRRDRALPGGWRSRSPTALPSTSTARSSSRGRHDSRSSRAPSSWSCDEAPPPIRSPRCASGAAARGCPTPALGLARSDRRRGARLVREREPATPP